jgi:lipoprotein-anchoring transpeptidase ErfK/SrfK
MIKLLFSLCAFFFAAIIPLQTRAAIRPVPVSEEHARQPIVRLLHGTTQFKEFSAFDSTAIRGGYLTTGDIDGDGEDEFVVGSGMGIAPSINIFEKDGKFVREIRPYIEWFKGGVRVATGDINGDGTDEIFTAPGPGIQSFIIIFSAKGERLYQTSAYDKSFIGGAHIASADIDADGKPEIIVSPGPGGGPHIRVFDQTLSKIKFDFFSYDAAMTEGVNVATMRTPKGNAIVTAPESWSMPIVRTWLGDTEGTMKITTEFLADHADSINGISLSSYDLDNDGFDEIVTSPNGGHVPDVTLFDFYGTPYLKLPYSDVSYRGSLSLVQSKTDKTGGNSLFSLTTFPTITGPADSEKSILVKLNEQRLYAYEHGRVAKTFLISSGVKNHPTPIAKTTVQKKIPIMDYRWNYGVNNPNNYFLPNVKFNLNILPHIYIHNAYWHNNFGNRMSHGCINAGLKDSEWIYNWSEVGTPVEIK